MAVNSQPLDYERLQNKCFASAGKFRLSGLILSKAFSPKPHFFHELRQLFRKIFQ